MAAVTASSSFPLLVVGLGNPGPRYRGTRHNIGAEVIDELAARHRTSLSVHRKTNTDIAQVTTDSGARLLLATARSMMNLSGGPIKALAQYFSLPPERICVIYDDLDLDFGSIKTRLGGGDHGHNGLRSLTKALGTAEYHRVAVGIGRPPGRQAPASFVLKPWSKSELPSIPVICADAADAVEELL